MMSNKTHTPGPWEASNEPVASEGILIHRKWRDKKGRRCTQFIASVCVTSPDSLLENCKANANLIAAAPDMYAALKAIYYGDGSLTESEIVKQMRAAIEKAEGSKESKIKA